MKKLVLFFICLGFILVSCQQPTVEKEESEIQVKTTKVSSPSAEDPVVQPEPDSSTFELPVVSCVYEELDEPRIIYYPEGGYSYFSAGYVLTIHSDYYDLGAFEWFVPAGFEFVQFLSMSNEYCYIYSVKVTNTYCLEHYPERYRKEVENSLKIRSSI